MAYLDEARILTDMALDKNLLKSSIHAPDYEDALMKFMKGSIKVEMKLEGRQRTIGTAFILGHADNGVLGTSVLGAGTMGSWTVIIQREWNWRSESDLSNGTSVNVDTSNGDIRVT